MSGLSVRLYAPGLPPAGCDTQLACVAGALHLSEPARVLPTEGLQLRQVGMDGRGLELAWDTPEGRWAVQALDADTAARLLAALPEGLRPAREALQRETRRRGRGRRLGWAALGLVLATPLLALLAFFVFADPMAAWVAARIPVEHERKLGDASFASMQPGLKLQTEGEALRAVREIGARLTVGSRYRYDFHVVENPQINAFAMPGGIVVVHTGLIAATRRPEELAGVLAHEVQHVELRHSLKGMVKQLGLSALWALATGDIGGGLAGQAAQQMLGLSFSREAEREADEHGLDALIRAGIDPTGMPAFFGTLADKSLAPPAILSTHPDSAERQQRLAELLRTRAPAAVPPLPYAPWPPR